MRYSIESPNNLAIGDSFSLMNTKFTTHVVQKIIRKRISGLTIFKIHIGKNLMPISLTKGTHVYKITQSKTAAA